MSNEVELKLAVISDAFDILKTHLNQFNILEQNTAFLGNTYFDYPDHFLAKQKMGLRVRRENNDFTLTLKTDGKVVGGLHSRPEYNLSILDDSVPTSAQLTSLYPFEHLPSAALQPIFSTDFNRTFWLIAFGASKIEVAFDQGKILSGEKTQPICEIEFELKEGLVSDLFYFVSLLPFEQDVYFSSASKAKRGYQLGSKQLLIDWLNKWRDFLKEEREGNAVDSREQLSAVMKMEQLLGVYERLIDDLAGYMKENGIDYTNDDSVHPAIMLYSEAGRIYSRLLRTRKIEDLLRMEGEYNLMNGMVNEMKAGAWANLSGEDVSRKVM